MFKLKKKQVVPCYAVVLQKEIDEILEIIEEQQKQIERLTENLKILQELCSNGAEQ